MDASTNVTNMPAIQARVSAWIYMQNPEQINQILEELNMIRLENNFENQKRLQDNLLGKYNPNDFMPEHEIADAELENARQTRLKSKANDIASESLDKSLERTKVELELDKLKDQEWEAIEVARKQLHELQETVLNREKTLQNKETEAIRARYNELLSNKPGQRRSVTFTELNQNLNNNQYTPAASSPLHGNPRTETNRN